MNALFICNQGRNRSKTAEHLFNKKFNTESAGLYNGKPVNKRQISWADVIFVMEEEQRSELSKRFPELYMQKRILCLNVPDVYCFNDGKLIEILKFRIREYSDLFA